jgi:hypothetical protein
MTISWLPQEILALCYNEVDCQVLNGSGYGTIFMPSLGNGDILPAAPHYIVVTNGDGLATAKDLAAQGVGTTDISYANLNGFEHLGQAYDKGGPDLVREIIGKSRSVRHDQIHPFIDVVKPEYVPSYPTAYSFLDQHLRWSDTELVCIAGPYGGGKSLLTQILACDWADVSGRQKGATAAICAFEDANWRTKRNIERFAETREDLRPMKGPGARKDDLLRRVLNITCRHWEVPRTIEWYLEACAFLLKRHNTRFFVFDPWNQHDEERQIGDTETQYVNKMLREITKFAQANNVIQVVVTHISQRSYDDEGGTKPFRIAQAHGSSHFGKMCDRGICVARTRKLSATEDEPDADRMIVRFDKAKDEESMGKLGNVALKFDPQTMDIDIDVMATDEIQAKWRF